MKVAIVSIAKNEAKHVKRWAESAKDADELIILDTGSEDDTVALAKEAGVTVHQHVFNPWRFDVARNHLLDLLPTDIDWVINLDLDEVMVPGWREALERVPEVVTAPRYKFVFAFNPDGSEGLSFQGYKVHRRFSHRWVNAVHEIMSPIQDEYQCFVEGFEIHHHQDHSKSRSQYMDLLKLSVEEDPSNDRNAYYYARELFYERYKEGNAEKAIQEFKRHLALPTAVWGAERAFSCRYLAILHTEPQDKYHWFMKAAAENPLSREVWLDMADFFYNNKDWFSCYHACMMGLRITEKPGHYLNEGWAWGFRMHDLAALSAWELGYRNSAITHGTNALALSPDDQRLKNNLNYFKGHDQKINVVIPTKSNIDGLTTLVAQLRRDYGVDKIVVVVDGEEAYKNIPPMPDSVIKLCMPGYVGNIHKMWNLGMQVLGTKSHIAFINDDVSLEPNCMKELAFAISTDDSIGIICPNYATEPSVNDHRDYDVYGVSGSRYDGWGGMAGFCFVLAKDLVPHWKFNEDLKWLAGDNEITEWVTQVMKRRVVVTHKARCKHTDAKTFNDDPPADWLDQMHRDKLEYLKKRESIEQANRKAEDNA